MCAVINVIIIIIKTFCLFIEGEESKYHEASAQIFNFPMLIKQN